MIKQITKEYKCIREKLILYFVIENRLLQRFEYVDIKHIPRLKNQEANSLAQTASEYKVSKEKLEKLIEILGKVLTIILSSSNLQNSSMEYVNEESFEVLAIDSLEDTDWRSPMINYLKNPIANADRKIKYRALSYVLMGNELFKMSQYNIS